MTDLAIPATLPEPDDRSLLDAFRHRHDQEAFARLVERHGPWVYALCLRVTRTATEAEEAAQDAFCELARCAHRVTTVTAWLHTVARRSAIAVLRRRSDHVPLDGREVSISAAGISAAGISNAGRDPISEDLLHLDQALDELDPDLRAILVARFLAGRSQESIAADTGLSQPTVHRRIQAGLDRLRELLEKRGVGLGCAAGPAAVWQAAGPASLPTSAQVVLGKVALVAQAAPGALVSMAMLKLAGSAAILALLLISGVVWLAWPQGNPVPEQPRPIGVESPLPITPLAVEPPAPPPGPLPAQPVGATAVEWEPWFFFPNQTEVRRAWRPGNRVRTMDGTDATGLNRWIDGRLNKNKVVLAGIDRQGKPFTTPPILIFPGGFIPVWNPLLRLEKCPAAWKTAAVRKTLEGIANQWQHAAPVASARLDQLRQEVGTDIPAPLAGLATVVRARAGKIDAAARYFALIPDDQADRWLVTQELHAAACGAGDFRLAQRLAAWLPSLVQPQAPTESLNEPAWPATWPLQPTPMFSEGKRLDDSLVGMIGLGAWETEHATLAFSSTIMPPCAIHLSGSAFTDLPSIGRLPPWVQISMIQAEPFSEVEVKQGISSGNRPGVGWQQVGDHWERVFDGVGRTINRFPAHPLRSDHTRDIRILIGTDQMTVWVDGTCRSMARIPPDRQGKPWFLTVFARNADFNGREVRILRPVPAVDDPFADLKLDELTRRGIDALRHHDVKAMKGLLTEGLDPTAQSLLQRAARMDAVSILEALLTDPRTCPDALAEHKIIPLNAAIQRHALGASRLLLARGFNPDVQNRYRWRPLGYLVRRGHLPLVEAFLDHGALVGPEGRNVTSLDCLGPIPQAKEIVEAFRKRGHPISAQAEVYAGNTAKVLEILADPQRRSAQGPGALAAAVLTDDVDLVRRILDVGVPVDVPDRNWWGRTALQLAVGVTADPLMVELLLARKADPDAPGRFGSARELAQQNGYPLPGTALPKPAPKSGLGAEDF